MNTVNKVFPNILVLLSVSGLVVFLTFWNKIQYEQAENTLKKELNFYLKSAANEVREKQLNSFVQRLDIEISNGGEGSSFSLKNDTLSKIVVWMDSSRYEHEEGDWSGKKHRQITYFLDTLLKGTDQFYGQIAETFGGKEGKLPERLNGLDLFAIESSENDLKETEQIIKLLTERLTESELPKDFTMPLKEEKPPKGSLALEFDRHRVLGGKNVVYFYNHGNYLLSKIVSSLLFSIFLLLLVVWAFAVLIRSRKQQQQIVEMRNDFISNMTHELKTPIATVSVAIEAIRKYDVLKDREKTEEYLDISYNELGRLSLLVEKVLRTTLFESGKGFLNPQPVDLTQIVNETVSTMNLYFKEKQVKLSKDISSQPLMVVGDKIHLTNVLYNLIENSIKYSQGVIEINIATKQVGQEVYFSIADKGIGISAENQKQIFDKFYRVPNHDRHNVKGYGLGLSYVKQVVEELGGRIDIQSQEGEGSTFVVQLKAVIS